MNALTSTRSNEPTTKSFKVEKTDLKSRFKFWDTKQEHILRLLESHKGESVSTQGLITEITKTKPLAISSAYQALSRLETMGLIERHAPKDAGRIIDERLNEIEKAFKNKSATIEIKSDGMTVSLTTKGKQVAADVVAKSLIDKTIDELRSFPQSNVNMLIKARDALKKNVRDICTAFSK